MISDKTFIARREPDLEIDARLVASNGISVQCECKLWLPENASEDANIELSVPRSKKLSPALFTDSLTLRGSSGKRLKVEASGIHIQSFISRTDRLTGSNPIRLGHVDSLTIRRSLLKRDKSVPTPRWMFGLSDCRYLNPDQIVEYGSTGEVKVETVRAINITYLPIGHIVFEHHCRQSKHYEINGVVTSLQLVARVDGQASVPMDSAMARGHMSDVCLLLSLAARHRVVVLEVRGWVGASYEQRWFNPLERLKPVAQTRWMEALVDLSEVESFFDAAGKVFWKASVADKKRLREAIYPLVPAFSTGGIQSRFLALFSAFEGLISYGAGVGARRPTLLDKVRWRDAQKAIKKAITQLGPEVSDQEKDLMRQKVGELNRPSLKAAASKFLADHHIDTADLWPIFGSARAPGLYEIRNRLAHGNPPPDDAMGALMVAKGHLVFLLERCLLTVLGHDVSNSRACIGEVSHFLAADPTQLEALSSSLGISEEP